MQRPDSVWIGPFLIKIIWDSGLLAKDAQESGMPSLAGISDGSNLYIILDERLPEPKARDTLLHEIMHIMWYQAAIRNVENPTEEFIIDTMSLFLLTMMRNNPDVVAYLVGSNDPNERSYANDLIILLAPGGGEDTQDGEGES